jgi:hypothetical protein
MNNFGSDVCTICGGQRTADTRWFLITESHWEDKLRILRWTDSLAGKDGMHRVCSPPHARELVVHWMTTGSLDYPFARIAARHPWRARRGENMSQRSGDLEIANARIGELAVHRESVGRALGENPLALNTILDELLIVLRREAGEVPSEVDAEDEIAWTAAQEM